MDFKKFSPWSFSISFVLIIIGTIFKITYMQFANIFLGFGLLSFAFFMAGSIYEISNSKRIEGTEKFIWIMGFIFFGVFTGLLYLLSYRRKII